MQNRNRKFLGLERWHWIALLILLVLAINLLSTSLLPADGQSKELFPPDPISPGEAAANVSPSPIPAASLSADDLPPEESPEQDESSASRPPTSSQYIVQANDTLGIIAEQFGLKWEDLASFNQLANPNQLEIGQLLNIPLVQAADQGSNFMIIPDSELVYGPSALYLDIEGFINEQGGFLSQHRDSAEGKSFSGSQMIAKIARDYSVNPKILLTLLEMQNGWLLDSQPSTNSYRYPLNFKDRRRVGLYAQLAWAADTLNEGYYQWKSGNEMAWNTLDEVFISGSPAINAGTAAIQNLLARLYNEKQWRIAISEEGFFATYQLLFGNPFDFALEPQFPKDLQQVEMQLPFEEGIPWIFSGGPHSAWGNYSAWAALDFVPHGFQLGCIQSADWVVAVADGLILRADDGAVVQDLDGDGYEQSGWTVLYMHMAEYERVPAGTYLRAGERIGHPSCEGGLASASHLHLARRYNGEWIPASGNIPFVLDGWLSTSSGTIYDGQLQRDGLIVEACECYEPELTLQR